MSSRFHTRVLATNLPLDQIIVIGSGILDTLGIRGTSDIDLAVSDQLFDALKSSGEWHIKVAVWGETFLERNDCEVWRGWIMDDSGHPNYEDLLEDAIQIDGIRYVSLDYLYDWKLARGREKDLRDLRLIDTYRRTHVKNITVNDEKK